MIEDTPFITELQNEFYKTILAERKEKILDCSLQKNQTKEKRHQREAEL